MNSVALKMINLTSQFHPYISITSQKHPITGCFWETNIMTLKENIMSIRILALAAAAVITAGSASAQSVSAGDVQLALKAGVEPGAYSTSQLIRLIDAQRENRTGQINFILNERDECQPATHPTCLRRSQPQRSAPA